MSSRFRLAVGLLVGSVVIAGSAVLAQIAPPPTGSPAPSLPPLITPERPPLISPILP